MSPTSCVQRELVAQHFAGTIRPPGERALREHLPSCGDCTRLYERHLLLAKLDPRSLDGRSRLARGLGLGDTPRSRTSWALAVAGLATATALALFAVAPPAVPELTARGPAAALDGVHLSVFRVEKGQAVPARARIDARDELAFSYENRAGKKRLMLFGVDEHGHVFWFFPAWQDPATDPAAIAIAPTERPLELGEAVAHVFDGDRLTLRALFTDEPLTVREVERRLARGTVPLSEGGLEQSFELSVGHGGSP